jgi:hypothetical protein
MIPDAQLQGKKNSSGLVAAMLTREWAGAGAGNHKELFIKQFQMVN